MKISSYSDKSESHHFFLISIYVPIYIYIYGPILVTVLDCVLSSVTITCIFSKLVYQLPLCSCCIWKIHVWGMTQSIQNFWQMVLFIGTNFQAVANSKKRKSLCQQLKTIYWNTMVYQWFIYIWILCCFLLY